MCQKLVFSHTTPDILPAAFPGSPNQTHDQTASSNTKQKHFPFLLLPPELRSQIYSHLLTIPQKRLYISYRSGDPRPLTQNTGITLHACPLLLLCRRIRAEATYHLYSLNSFRLFFWAPLFLSSIGDNSRYLTNIEMKWNDWTEFGTGPGFKSVLESVKGMRWLKRVVVKMYARHPVLGCMKAHVESCGLGWVVEGKDEYSGEDVVEDCHGGQNSKEEGGKVVFRVREYSMVHIPEAHIVNCDGACEQFCSKSLEFETGQTAPV